MLLLRQPTVLLPGLVIAAAVTTGALVANHWVATASPLLIAVLAGTTLANSGHLPAAGLPGLAFAGRTLLRAGVALLGLQLVLTDILQLGAGMVGVVVAIVAGGILLTLAIGRRLGVPAGQRLLIACGFSICGAAAVAAVEGVADVEDEEVATSIALVVLFGTLMIPVIPLASRLLGFSAAQAGGWAGGSIHEVAQVVAAGGVIGGAALKVGVVVKLARVVLLAPVLAVVGLQSRRSRATGGDEPQLRQPPIVPVFVLAFVGFALVRTTGVLPAPVLDATRVLQTALLTAAMFALGCGVHLASLRRVGGRPLVLAVLSTLAVSTIALAGPLLAL